MSKLLEYFLLILLGLESLSLAYWFSYPFIRLEAITIISRIQYQIFCASGKAGSVLVMIFLFSWAIAPISRVLSKVKGLSLTRSGLSMRIISMEKREGPGRDSLGKVLSKFVLLLALSLSCIIVVYPYLPSMNPDGRYVSVDAPLYHGFLLSSMGLDGAEILGYVFGRMSSRGLPIWIMYVLGTVTGAPPDLVVKSFPILLAALLTLSSYLLALVSTHDEERALYSALLSSTSIIVTVGMYAGYYADWLSISMALLSLCFTFRFMELGKPVNLLFASIFLILTNASHVWTWAFFSGGLALYLLHHITLEVLVGGQRLHKGKFLGVVFPVASGLAYDVLRSVLIGVGSTGVEIGYRTASSGIKIINLFLLQRNLNYMLEVFVGGLTCNVIYFALAAYGILSSEPGDELSKFFKVLLFASSFSFLFYDYLLQSRLLYSLPIHLMMTAGLLKVKKVMKSKGLVKESRAFLFLSILSSLNYALRSVLTFPTLD